jgi:hypothetical protein
MTMGTVTQLPPSPQQQCAFPPAATFDEPTAFPGLWDAPIHQHHRQQPHPNQPPSPQQYQQRPQQQQQQQPWGYERAVPVGQSGAAYGYAHAHGGADSAERRRRYKYAGVAAALTLALAAAALRGRTSAADGGPLDTAVDAHADAGGPYIGATRPFHWGTTMLCALTHLVVVTACCFM